MSTSVYVGAEGFGPVFANTTAYKKLVSSWHVSYSYSHTVISLENRPGPDKALALWKHPRHQNPFSNMQQEGGREGQVCCIIIKYSAIYYSPLLFCVLLNCRFKKI